MNFILLILPFAIFQLLSKQSIKMRLLSLPVAAAIAPIFSTNFLLPFYGFFLTLSLINTFHIRIFNYPLNIKSLKLIKNFSSLKDSLHVQIPLWFLPILLTLFFLYPIILEPSSFLTLLTLPLLFFSPKILLPYPYFLITTFFERKKQPLYQEIKDPENEIFYKSNKAYPLEKFTSGFCGKRIFSLPNKNPHVVVIYLESFKSAEIGAITPYFNQLALKGIYFSNFYANASQTFKAMFATLYGIPPCFGADFTESSSNILTLPLRGLPNIFKDYGYTNIFMKAGSHQFENQGQFLKNHQFDEIIDEKDIKKSNPKAYGTSWGVHDEFLYTHLVNYLKEAKSPLFINAASVTNHHPFILPNDFIPKFAKTDFQKTMEYSDYALSLAVNELTKLNKPIHLYIMGDHGYPLCHEGKPFLCPSLDKDVTYVPLLILPIGCDEIKPMEIKTVANQIDLLPTMMDLYNFKGKNSSLGSSLCRGRKNPIAYLLNESVIKISGEVTLDTYKTFDGYHPLYETLAPLFKEKKISTEKEDLYSLNFNSIAIANSDLNLFLKANIKLKSLFLADSFLIFSLNLNFPDTLETITLDNNLMIEDHDISFLPRGIKTLSIDGCRNLTDKALIYLEALPINELTLTANNFSNKALALLIKKIPLKKLNLKEAAHLDETFFAALNNQFIEEITLSKIKNLSDNCLKSIANPSLKIFMSDNCEYITDKGLFYLKETNLEVLHLEKSYLISNDGIKELLKLPIHTFFISYNDKITQDTMKQLETSFMQNIFCIDCKNLPQFLQEGNQKQIYYLQKNEINFYSCFDRYLTAPYTT